jgi:hypothetical protein
MGSGKYLPAMGARFFPVLAVSFMSRESLHPPLRPSKGRCSQSGPAINC